jgi:cytochrome c oxidase cbb3-type subunit 3
MVSYRTLTLSLLFLLAAASSGHAFSAVDGEKLYTRHCAACHGAEGNGGVGVPLSLPDLHAVVDDEYLRLTIRLGRPGRIMPAFSQLSEEEVGALIKHVRGFNKTKTKTITVNPPKGNVTRGTKLYADHCAACHGANGEGGHGTGVTYSRPRDLPVLAPALNNPGFLAAASDVVIKKTLVHGRKGTPMPSFLKQGMTEANIDDIVALVRSFAQREPAVSAKVINSENPILVRTSAYSVAETSERVQEAFSHFNMRVIRAVPFNQGMVDPKDENPQQMIVDACDFGFLNQALAVDPRVGLFLPCRVTITQHNDKVLVMAINPKRLSTIFNNSELNQLCDEMSKLYNDLLDEAVQ